VGLTLNQQFLADVVAAYPGRATEGDAFGSGRVIAPGLVLTAGHVVDHPTPHAPARIWKVCPRTKNGTWADPYECVLLWRGQRNLDLALLQITGAAKLTPVLKPEFALYDSREPINNVDVAGFPKATRTQERSRVYCPSGSLAIVSDDPLYSWSVTSAYKPDDPDGWEGMSGAAVSHWRDDRLYLFGVVQKVPANFSYGQLDVARVSDGFADESFFNHLQAALGSKPWIFKWGGVSSPRKSDSAIPEERPSVTSVPREVPEAVRKHTRLFWRNRSIQVEVWATNHHRLSAGITADIHLLVRTLFTYPRAGTISLKLKGDGIQFGPTAKYGLYDTTETSFDGRSPFEFTAPVLVSANGGRQTTQIELQVTLTDPWGSRTEPNPMSFNPSDIGL
jgi:hypothetical protein